MRDALFAALLCAVTAATATATAEDYAEEMARLRAYDDTVRPVIMEMFERSLDGQKTATQTATATASQ